MQVKSLIITAEQDWEYWVTMWDQGTVVNVLVTAEWV